MIDYQLDRDKNWNKETSVFELSKSNQIDFLFWLKKAKQASFISTQAKILLFEKPTYSLTHFWKGHQKNISMKTFRKIIRCQWGTETYKGFTESEDNFRGFSAPLWVNTSPGAFLIMFLWGMSVFFILLLVYIFYISGIETSCTTNFKTIIIFELIVVAINTIFDYLSYTTKYDSD